MLEECSPYRQEGFSEKWEDGEEKELDYAKQVHTWTTKNRLQVHRFCVFKTRALGLKVTCYTTRCECDWPLQAVLKICFF